MAQEAFLVNPQKRTRRKPTKKKTAKRSIPKKRKASRRKKRASKNPYRKEVGVVGRNPRRRKRRSTRKRKRSYKRRRNPVTAVATTRRRRRRNPVRKATRRRTRRNYPVARRRRRRRNPAMAIGAINLKRPMTLLMPIGTGIASLIATRKIPDAMNLVGNMRTLAQVGVAVGGGLVLKGVVGNQNAAVWTIVSLVNTVGELLSTRVGGIFSGMSAFVDYESGYPIPGDDSMMGAFVDGGPYDDGGYESQDMY